MYMFYVPLYVHRFISIDCKLLRHYKLLHSGYPVPPLVLTSAMTPQLVPVPCGLRGEAIVVRPFR